MITTRPTKDLNRLLFLETARKHINTCLEQTPDTPYTCLVGRFDTIPEEFDTAMHNVRKATGIWRKAVKKRLDAANPLSRCCRDFYASLERRTEREGHGAHLLEYFKMQSDASLPKPSQIGAWVLIARDLIEGDQLAIADGYPPMINPGCADLQKHLDVIDKANENVSITHMAQQDAQKTLNELREEADLLFRRLYHLLVGWLLEETPGRRRNAMRKFGYVFGSDNTENPNAVQEPVAPEIPAGTVQTAPDTTNEPLGVVEVVDEPEVEQIPLAS